jgi:hypothetical protein
MITVGISHKCLINLIQRIQDSNLLYKTTIQHKMQFLTRPILSSRTTSSLLSSQRSLRMGFLNTAPDLPVTGRPLWYWCSISSCTVGNAGPSNRKWPCGAKEKFYTANCIWLFRNTRGYAYTFFIGLILTVLLEMPFSIQHYHWKSQKNIYQQPQLQIHVKT